MRRPNQSILKEINPEYSLEGLMLKLQYFGIPDVKSQLIGKDPNAGKDWRQKEKKVTEGEMVEWNHWFNGNELGQTLGDSEGQGGLMCCSLWSRKELDTTEQLNNDNLDVTDSHPWLKDRSSCRKSHFTAILWACSGPFSLSLVFLSVLLALSPSWLLVQCRSYLIYYLLNRQSNFFPC